MRKLSSIAIAGAALFCAAALSAQQTGSASRELHVLSSNGIEAVLEEILPEVERAIGRHIVVEFDTSTTLRRRMEADEGFDVGILAEPAMDAVIQSGKIVVPTRTNLARSGLGVGVRDGAPKPDIRTLDSLKQAFLHAKSVTYAGNGASRPDIERMMQRLGIAEEMKAKTVLADGSAGSTVEVAQGKVEMIVTLVSEIISAEGLDLIAPVPQEVQGYVMMTGGVGAQAKDPEGAQAFLRYLTTTAVEPALKQMGMQR